MVERAPSDDGVQTTIPEISIESLPHLYTQLRENCVTAREIITEIFPTTQHGTYTVVDFDLVSQDTFLAAFKEDPVIASVFVKNAALSEREIRTHHGIKNIAAIEDYTGRLDEYPKARNLAQALADTYTGSLPVEALIYTYHKRFEADQRRQYRRKFEQHVRNVLQEHGHPVFYGGELPGEPDFVLSDNNGYAVVGEIRSINTRDWSNRRVDFLKEARQSDQFDHAKFVVVVELAGKKALSNREAFREELYKKSDDIDGIFFSDELKYLAARLDDWGTVKQGTLTGEQPTAVGEDVLWHERDTVSTSPVLQSHSLAQREGESASLSSDGDPQQELGGFDVDISQQADSYTRAGTHGDEEIVVSFPHMHLDDPSLEDMYDRIDAECGRIEDVVQKHFTIEQQGDVYRVRFDIADREQFENALTDDHEVMIPLFVKLLGLSDREIQRRHGDVGSITSVADRKTPIGILHHDAVEALLDDVLSELTTSLTMQTILHLFHVSREFDWRRHARNPGDKLRSKLQSRGFTAYDGTRYPGRPPVVVRQDGEYVFIGVKRTFTMDERKRLNHFYGQSETLKEKHPDSKFIGVFELPSVDKRRREVIRTRALDRGEHIDAFHYMDEIRDIVTQLEKWGFEPSGVSSYSQ